MTAKKDDLIQMRIDGGNAAKLRKIAEHKRVEPAELLRRATYAMIESFETNGDVPLEMAIKQRAFEPRVLLAAEDQATFGRSPAQVVADIHRLIDTTPPAPQAPPSPAPHTPPQTLPEQKPRARR